MVVCNVAESWTCFVEGESQRELGTKVISFPEPALLKGATRCENSRNEITLKKSLYNPIFWRMVKTSSKAENITKKHVYGVRGSVKAVPLKFITHLIHCCPT